MTYATRPKDLLAPPVKLDPAFDDPDGILDLIRRGSPYKTLSAVHRNVGETSAGWFRNFWALGGKVVFDGAEPFFYNERFIEAAKTSFNAEVIRPLAMMTNLNLPAPSSPCHLDLPFFRGANNREVPSWMLDPMGYSGLFHEWAIPVASAITWFYDGEGGDFEYWPRGLDAPSVTESPPFSNSCVLADNEYMYHRVGSVGPEKDQQTYEAIGYDAKLELMEDQRWQVNEDGKTLASFDFDEVRISILWKAYCFKNEAMAESYDDHSNDLSTDLIADIFCDDLTKRGHKVSRPSDFATDAAWKELITTVYAPPSAD
ncbi:MAG: hypothetical protein NXI13_04305 [Proteobacteria bacterium]|nr:hypothetical protein [Pseudomonadota bacterium]